MQRLTLFLAVPVWLGVWSPARAQTASAQTNAAASPVPAVRAMQLDQTWYDLKIGEPVPLDASSETLDFIAKSETREIRTGSGLAKGLRIGKDASGQVVLAASPLAKPGRYDVTVTVTSAAGEVRQTAMIAVVDQLATVPLSAKRNPVVLLNGWEEGFAGSCPIATTSSETFGNLASYLVSDGVPVVYLFDNCLVDPDEPVEQLGSDLGDFLNSIKYTDGSQVPQIDLVAFSLGGLVARAYLAGLQTDGSLVPPDDPLVGKMVLIATPNFGSFLAGNNASLYSPSPQFTELVPGSLMLWNLANWNQRTDDLRGVNAVAVAGNAGSYTSLTSGSTLNNATDGLVTLTSASIGFVSQQALQTRIVPYCHVDPSAFTNTTLGAFNCNAPGIANVTSTAHLTGQIVRSFLGGATDWQSVGDTPATDPYLSKQGGMYFGLVSKAGALATDLQKVSWGTVSLTNGGAIGSIFYGDFLAGSGVLAASSTSLGNANCGTYSVATGYFSAVRCKFNATVLSVGPLLTTLPRVVGSGGTITITGADLASQCGNCKVTALAAGSSTAQNLQVTSWSNTSIQAALPATYTGLVMITVYASTGTDSMSFFAEPLGGPALSVSSQSVTFNYSVGDPVPAAQSVSISNSGSGTLNWSASASDSWVSVSPVSGTAAGSVSISVNPANLAAGTYTSSVQITAEGATGSPSSVAVKLVVTGTAPAPAITAVQNAAGFQSGVAPAAWISIFGTNLSSVAYTWQASDIVNGALPTSLENVSVTIDGKPAYVQYISPAQINVLAPDDGATGSVQVRVTVGGQASNSFTVDESQFLPAFFTIGGGPYVAALHTDYTLVATAGLISGVTSRPAQPGETIALYGAGFGPSNPALPTGQVVNSPAMLANAVQVTIGGMDAPVVYAGLVGPGTYQLNVTVPDVPDGDAPLAASIDGIATPMGVSVTVQH